MRRFGVIIDWLRKDARHLPRASRLLRLLELPNNLILILNRWEKLNLVRVYTKPKGKLPDYTAPVVLRSTRCTVEDFVSGFFHRSENDVTPHPVTD